MTFQAYLTGDAAKTVAQFPDDTFAAVVTSPPYWANRKYGEDDREIGQESLEDYLRDLTEVFSEVRRTLAPTGLFWLNIGDTASGSGGAGGDYNAGGSYEKRLKYRQGASGLAPGQWCSVPHRLVHRLQDDGWLLRSEVVWDKGRVRREDINHVRRPLPQHESIFMLAKSKQYVFDHTSLETKGTVWNFPPSSGAGLGFAPYPVELAERCILPSSQPGDIVLDVFGGSASTMVAARAYDRSSVMIDLFPEMAEVGIARMKKLYPDQHVITTLEETLEAING